MKLKIISFLTLICLISALVLPATALATPITGADMDITKLFFYNGSYTDDTDDANNATADDVDWPTTGGQTIYFGGSSTFNSIYFYVSAENRSSAWDIATSGGFEFQYFDGEGWTSLTVVNETGAWNATGIHYFSLTPPGLWASTTINGANNYYLRVACDMSCNQMMGSFDIDQISLGTGVGGGGAAVPEFSTYVLLFSLCVAGFVTFKKTQVQGFTRA